jgi:predicted CoA-binding protein
MKQTIQDFIDEKKIAIVGASNNRENFGLTLMKELAKSGVEVLPVNPRYQEVYGISCVSTVKELPQEFRSVILAVPSTLTDDIVEECIGTQIERIWMIQGVGRGSYSETAHHTCKENHIEVVYGFCPLMFLGGGVHRFHGWIRKTFGKVPVEYKLSQN